MRIILSHGQVNIFNLAWNSGTSVNQIERCYARHLPLSREMIRTYRALEKISEILINPRQGRQT
ncbi:MAG: hypothetical protein ACERJ2_09315 [Filomicrobium sp.]